MAYSDHVLPQDDRLHPKNDDPYWNESSYVSFIDPDSSLQGMFYFYFRPNMNLAVGGPVLWDSSGRDAYDCLHYAWDQTMPIPPGSDMYDFDLPNGFSARTVQPLKEIHFTYRALGVEMDLTWTAIMDPYLMKMEREQINRGIADFLAPVEELTIGHYEQAGRLRGTINYHGRVIEIDCPSLRDHTWGPRPTLTTMARMRGAYPFAVAADDHHFHLYAMSMLPCDEDPIAGTTEQVVSGWYTRDGVQADLVSGTRRCLERAADGTSLYEVLDATDSLGRRLYAEGRPANWFKFTLYSDWLDIFSLTRWTFDGVEVWGESQDYLLFRQFRKLVAGTQRV
ncbi:hypothetical protein MycrhDRAFT_1208 [Mycolicibacterium rhodesiae JS60]|nr:hypothetical protein MycrhDRAFT_1208 [Mycolicibacterium rhodesiae JS60]